MPDRWRWIPSERPGMHFLGAPRQHEIALELGMGRGRCALQLFLQGATVLGVELAFERYRKALEAMERLAHRCPEELRVSFQNSKARLMGANTQTGFMEVRYGDFFQIVKDEEIAAATLIFLQVCLPRASWPSVRSFLEHCSPGCRVLTFQACGEQGGETRGPSSFPFRDIGSPVLACTWATAGHRFHCYERLDLEEERRILERSGLRPEHLPQTRKTCDERQGWLRAA
ncbi:unnamed protein product [Durusdinium trenchii]|uniref:Class I SAM-dependent methyltransferase n=1 Tax=Durusdinium trenchii TaxID=1381693 RepID=A0ABP0HCE6_9DINO